jgi:hypothetical protein
MKKILVVTVAVLALAGCSNSTASPSTTSPTPSESISVSPFQALSDAVDTSINKMMAEGSMEFYEVDGQPYYTAVFDPKFKGDYLGAGLMSESDQVDLMLELDMYGLYQLARAVSGSPMEATTLDGDTYLVTIDANRKGLQGFPKFMRATVGADGLIESVEYPAERQPDFVRFQYSVNAAGTEILQRANDEIKP